MEKKMSPLTRLIPCSVVLLSAAAKQKKDAMTATCMFVSENPAYFVVSVAKSSTTCRLIEESAEFVLNIASASQVKLAKALGATRGSKVDKFAQIQNRHGKIQNHRLPRHQRLLCFFGMPGDHFLSGGKICDVSGRSGGLPGG